MPSKKGKSKQTISLDEFNANFNNDSSNANSSIAPPANEGSWADAPFDPRSGSDKPSWERRDSPSNVQRRMYEEPDFSKVPDEPPFKAFVTNVAYNANREDLEEFFGRREIRSIFMIRNEEGNFRGSANIEFHDKQGLIDALKLHGSSMLNRTIRVEVSSQGAGRNRQGDSSNRNRSDYTPVSEISDDSWSRGEDYRQPSQLGKHNDGAQSGSERYVPPNRRSGDSSLSNSNSFSRPASNYSDSRYSASTDNRSQQPRFGGHDSNNIRSSYDTRDHNRHEENRRNYNDNRHFDGNDMRRMERRNDSGDRYHDSGRTQNHEDGYNSYDRRGGRDDHYRSQNYGDSEYSNSYRREDRYEARDRPPMRDRDPMPLSRDESPRRKVSDFSRASDNNQDSQYRSRDESDYYSSRNEDHHQRSQRHDESGSSQLSSRSNADSTGRNSDMRRPGSPPYNSGHKDYHQQERNRTYSQRSSESYGGDGQQYTLESSGERSNMNNEYNDSGSYSSRNQRYDSREQEKNREHERRYERYQNDIAPRTDRYDERRRTDSGSGSGIGGYDNRRNDGRGVGYRDGNRDRDRRGPPSHSGYSSGGGSYQGSDYRSQNDYGRYDRGGSNRTDYYDRRDQRRPPAAPHSNQYSPNKHYDDDPYYDSNSGRQQRQKLDLAPRSTTEPVSSVPKEAESRPYSIFGAAKPVDTSQRELEVARKAGANKPAEGNSITKNQNRQDGKRIGGQGGGAYRPPHFNSSHSSEYSKSSNSRNNGPGVGDHNMDLPSPDSVINRFAVLNTDNEDDYQS